MKTSIFILIIILFSCELMARDIDLDAIYLKRSSKSYVSIVEKKLDAYQFSRSQLVDSGVIFAYCLNGFEFAYIKEFKAINILYVFHRINLTKTEIVRFPGIVASVSSRPSGSLFLVKTFVAQNGFPKTKTLIINLRNKTVRTLDATQGDITATLSPSGDSVFIERKNGINEYDPYANQYRLVLPTSRYFEIASKGVSAAAFFSPDRQSAICLCGSGGKYRAKLIVGKNSFIMDDITSTSELYWLNNNEIVYRSGFPGSFNAQIKNIRTGKNTLLVAGSLNTNIKYSQVSRSISYLHDQVITVYDLPNSLQYITGLEGEDVDFTPDGQRFASLYLKKLFITTIHTIKTKNIELKRIFCQISDEYSRAIKSREDWMNEYTPQYLNRKLQVYKKLSE